MSTETPAVPETVDALLAYTTPALTRQYDVADGLDQKALGALGLSGAVITIAGSAQAAGSPPRAAVVLLVLAAAVWLAVSATAVWQLWTKRFRSSLAPDTWQDRRFYDTEKVKEQLLEEAAEAYRENREINRRKARAVRLALAGAAVETVIVAAALVASLTL